MASSGEKLCNIGQIILFHLFIIINVIGQMFHAFPKTFMYLSFSLVGILPNRIIQPIAEHSEYPVERLGNICFFLL
jgi:hypothetical protein